MISPTSADPPPKRVQLFVPERKPAYYAAFYLDPSPEYMDERIFYVYPVIHGHGWFPVRLFRERGVQRRWYVTAAQAKASGTQNAPRGSKEKIRACKVWPITIPKGAVRVGWAFVQTFDRGKDKPDGITFMCTGGRFSSLDMVNDGTVDLRIHDTRGSAEAERRAYTKDLRSKDRYGVRAIYAMPEEKAAPAAEPDLVAMHKAIEDQTIAACARDIVGWFGLVEGCSWALIEAWAKANAPILREATATPGGPPTLRKLQLTLPWSDTYRQAFRDNREPQRDFRHALIHIVKAAGALASLVDELDHEPGPTTPCISALGTLHVRYLADVVIAALRAANTYPHLVVDLQSEVLARLDRNAEQKGTST